jgi:hypothetical protein
MRIQLLGIYPVEAPERCHLIELLVLDHIGPVDLIQFTQETPSQPRSNWQVPYEERVLDSTGTKDLLGPYPEIIADGSPLRLIFFFHFLDLEKSLITPAGEIALPEPIEQPDRLSFLKYVNPD